MAETLDDVGDGRARSTKGEGKEKKISFIARKARKQDAPNTKDLVVRLNMLVHRSVGCKTLRLFLVR